MPVGPAQFGMNRCNESPLRGEKPDFWPVSKSNTGSLPLRGILPVINYRHSECVSDGSMWKTEQLNRAAVVGDVTSLAEPRTAVLGVN